MYFTDQALVGIDEITEQDFSINRQLGATNPGALINIDQCELSKCVYLITLTSNEKRSSRRLIIE